MHIGIDLAWGPKGRTGLAEVDAAGRLTASASVRTDEEIAAWLEGRRPVVVAIDAPLVVRNATGARPGERAIGAAYRRYHAGPHPTNLGTRYMSPPRGLRLAERLGWSVDPAHPFSAASPVALEVYPHPGMVGLLRLGRVLRYKKGPFDQRRPPFARLLGLLEGVPELGLPESPAWGSLRARFAAATTAAGLDRIEDEVDAVFCAHLAWLWAARPGALQVYGSAADGAIIAPPPPTHAPAAFLDQQFPGDAPPPEPADRRVEEEPLIPERPGVGPWVGAWPEGAEYDPALLRDGDARNVVDRYRYWTMAAIVADLDARRHPFAVAIENWQHDANIGSIVRTANAFLADSVHIVGRRRWNRRGAMVTDRYQHVDHHDDVAALLDWAASTDRTVVAVDNLPGSVALEAAELPERCVLLFGQEGPGLTPEALAAARTIVRIPQYGSTRSINAAAAAAIVMHEWVRRWAAPDQEAGVVR